jgi:hypothetical protein
MLDRWLKLPAHYYLHFVGALLIAVGLPLNKVVMSIGTIWVISNIVLEAEWRTYIKNLKSSPIFLSILAIFALHIVGLIYSTDVNYAFNDIRKKLPFLVIPFALIAKPLSKGQISIILTAFVGVTLVTSLISVLSFYLNGHFSDGTDIRYLTLKTFGSHIRFGLIVVFSLCIALFHIVPKKPYPIAGIIAALWFLTYLFVGQVLSANFAVILLIIGVGAFFIFQIKAKKLFYPVLLLFVGGLAIGIWLSWSIFRPEKSTLTFSQLPEHSALGNPYYHDTLNLSTENGVHIMSFIQEEELKQNWAAASSVPYDGNDAKGQLLMGTLIRYMSSKGLTKDSEGFAQLTAEDIQQIETGIPSVRYKENRYMARIDGLKFQIQNYYSGGSSSGHSLLQRFEHWRAAWHIIKSNCMWGVGTGDLQLEFEQAYREIQTDLSEEKWDRAHNQYLTFWVSFGIPGLVLFIIYSFLLIKLSIEQKSVLGLCFAIIAIASFIPEDTLETQQGVTFIALFTGLGIFQR